MDWEKKFDTLFVISEIDLREYEEEIIDWVKDNYEVEQIFSESKLRAWAVHNGYIKESK
jgi:hypothetical protein